MGMSNAERQKRYRERVREKLTQVPSGGLRSLPAIFASLPDPKPEEVYDGDDQSDRGHATYLLSEMLPQARELVEFLTYRHPTQAAEVAALFGFDPDPVKGMVWPGFFAALDAATLPKAEVKQLMGGIAGVRWLDGHRNYTDPISVAEAHTLRALLERLGLPKAEA